MIWYFAFVWQQYKDLKHMQSLNKKELFLGTNIYFYILNNTTSLLFNIWSQTPVNNPEERTILLQSFLILLYNLYSGFFCYV